MFFLRSLTKTGSNLTERQDSAATGDGSSGLIYGGINFAPNANTYYNDVFKYTVSGSNVAVNKLTQAGNNLSRVYGGGITGDSSSGVIYGGRTTNSWATHLYIYSVSGNTITLTIPSGWGVSNNQGRGFFGITGTATAGIIFGGYDYYWARVKGFIRYSISGNVVYRTELTVSGDAISARTHVQLVGTATEGIIFGGNDGVWQNDFYKYSVTGNTITLTLLTKVGGSSLGTWGVSILGDKSSGMLFGGVDTNDFHEYTISGSNITITKKNIDSTGATILPRDYSKFLGTKSSAIIFNGNDIHPVNTFSSFAVSGGGITYSTLNKSGSTISNRSSPGMTGNATDGVIFGGWGVDNNAKSDFYKYSVSGSTATITALTKSGSISNRYALSMLGDVNSGLIYGGGDTNFYKYAISGNTVTVTGLTKSGSAISALRETGMAGNTTSGVIFGGFINIHPWISANFYKYSVSGNTVTLTLLTKTGSAINATRSMGIVGTASSGLIFGGYQNNSPYAVSNFYKYSVSGSTVTLTVLTKSGSSISGRYDMGMVGTETSGVIYGGNTRFDRLEDAYSYSVSGNTVTLQLLTKSGTITNRDKMGMVGTSSGGLIFGGEQGDNQTDFYHSALQSSISGLRSTSVVVAQNVAAADYLSISVIGNVADSITLQASDLSTNSSSPTRIKLGPGKQDFAEFYRSGTDIYGKRGTNISETNKVRVLKIG